ncbi:MAG: IS1634 family transposase [Flavobacteriia bacterium]|nr:IS1634 family transposase [Flavobacteriia bacterium]
MFVRKKLNKSGLVSVQVIDKSSGKYKVIKTIGSSHEINLIEKFVKDAEQYIIQVTGKKEFDFFDYSALYNQVLSSISSHKLVGIELVLGKIFDEIGFNEIKDELFRDLVLYRLVYPKSKLKTTEYLSRYQQKRYTEDEIYRYMDKLNESQKEDVQRISYRHTLKILQGNVQVVFYDVTTIYFETDYEDELRKTGFSKEGKHQNPQIVLGLLVSKGGYPLAYDIFEGKQYEGHTMLPIINSFKEKYNIDNLVVIADSGLLSADNIKELENNKYEFILGARIKNEKQNIKDEIKGLSLKNGESKIINKDNLKLIISFSEDRAKKDKFNREKGLKRLEKSLKTGKLTKTSINNRGYNKFLEMDGEISLKINEEKIQEDEKWDGLKGYITNSTLDKTEILENYRQLWAIEKAFRIAKTDLKIRPIFHYKKRRIEAHICLNFVAYKVYKELERQLNEKKTNLSPEKVIEIVQSIYQVEVITPQTKEKIKRTLILNEEQIELQKIFNF